MQLGEEHGWGGPGGVGGGKGVVIIKYIVCIYDFSMNKLKHFKSPNIDY